MYIQPNQILVLNLLFVNKGFQLSKQPFPVIIVTVNQKNKENQVAVRKATLSGRIPFFLMNGIGVAVAYKFFIELWKSHYSNATFLFWISHVL